MKIRNQISLVTVGIVLLSTVVFVSVAVTAIRSRAEADMRQYREGELEKTRRKLKTLVDTAVGIVDTNYQNAHNKAFLEKFYGYRMKNIIDIVESIIRSKAALVAQGSLTLPEAQRLACEEIRSVTYDNRTGYVWINDMGRPYPTMIMHPTMPTLEGKVLDDPQFNCALGKDVNLFQAFVEVCANSGGGFVDYRWPKPTEKGLIPDAPKLSYVRLFPQWGWILGTGIYIDDAMSDAVEKSKSDVRSMRYDDGTGYLWINDMGRPYPTMVMHPTIPSLEGQVMDNPEYNNCAFGKSQNLFQAFVDVCTEKGDGFVDYLWPKPTKEGLSEPAAKLSYVRLYEPLGWVIGTGVYIDNIETEIEQRLSVMNEHINRLVLMIVFTSILIVLAAIGLSFAAGGTLTRPIRQLIASMKEIQEEGLTLKRVKLRGSEEIEKLGTIFNQMVGAIMDGVTRLAESTADKERIESELRIAREIQMGILPRLFPAFPERSEFDIHAAIDPAKEVGGDLYDFFFLDEDSFCFLVGDVSGKGVPAAFFMAVTKTLIKAVSESRQPIGEIITKVNRDMSFDNKSGMFVTLFCAVLNVKTGEVHYTNAGHNPPMVIRKGEEPFFLKGHGPNQLVAGFMDDVVYRTDTLRLSPGDTLFLYTDGVTEAMNPESELYSDERLLVELSGIEDVSGKLPEDLIRTVFRSVRKFAAGAEQSDDITMLALRFRGDRTT